MTTKIAIFISGTGSNLKALLEYFKNKQDVAQIKVIITNNPNAYGVKYAEEYGIPNYIIDNPKKSQFEDRANEILTDYKIDIICLAGFMKILSQNFIQKWGKIINIHPSLLPDFKGLHAIQQAWDAKASTMGCSIHWVNSLVDSGMLITQGKLSILKGDTLQDITDYIHKIEHSLYPQTIHKIINPKLIIPESIAINNRIIKYTYFNPI